MIIEVKITWYPNLTGNVIDKQTCQTIDLGGNAKTRDMTRAILDEIQLL